MPYNFLQFLVICKMLRRDLDNVDGERLSE